MCFAKFRNPTVTSRISAGYPADIRHPDHGFRRQGVKKLTKSRATKRKEKTKKTQNDFLITQKAFSLIHPSRQANDLSFFLHIHFYLFHLWNTTVALVLNQSKARFPHSKGPYLSFLCDIYLCMTRTLSELFNFVKPKIRRISNENFCQV